ETPAAFLCREGTKQITICIVHLGRYNGCSFQRWWKSPIGGVKAHDQPRQCGNTRSKTGKNFMTCPHATVPPEPPSALQPYGRKTAGGTCPRPEPPDGHK